ncbi:MAG: hypothetical protein WBO12_24965, partial [Xanthobacteraceae bacterium]
GKAAAVKMFAVVDRAARLTAGRTLDGGKPTDLPVVQATNPRMPFAALQESAPGTKRTFNCRPAMSAFGGKADVRLQRLDVRV